MKEKLSKVGTKIKTWGREFWYFISSMLFLKNFGGMLGILLLFFGITVLFLKCYTNHGNMVELTSFVNMTYKEALAIADDKDLELMILDSIFDPRQEPGTVISQTPKAETSVKEGRTIYLTVTKFIADEFQLPPFSESSYDYSVYSRKLTKKQVKSKIVERVFDARQANESIVHIKYKGEIFEDRDIKRGVKVAKGSTVEFVVTKRQSSVVQIPKLVCQPFDEAKFLATNSSLKIGEVIEDNTVTSRANAYVWKQEPTYASQKMIDKGAAVKVYLTENLPASCN
ncbi:MAG: beta-lactam-binding protein with PASTA domain [Saprospiraceae bacterium]|jgi:beta-lactam-binding protein with PASTA domain